MAGTLYDVLGVAPGVSVEALRTAHREQARRLHPDVGAADASAMRSLNEAWAVLSDPTRRVAYDRTLVAPPGGSGPSGRGGPPTPREARRVRLWPFLVIGAGLLVIVTAYAGRPADTSTRVEPVGQCLVEGADLDRTESCRSAGGRRIVAVGGAGVQCPSGSDLRILRGDAQRRTVCVSRVAGR